VRARPGSLRPAHWAGARPGAGIFPEGLHTMPSHITVADESFLRLHAAGWSIGDAAYVERGSGVLVWLVTGTNGENLIRAEGTTRNEAWREAVGQALAVGMIATPPTMNG
jgi:hypothetical protein